MRTTKLLAVAMVTLTSLPLMAQQVGASAEQSGSVSAAGTQVNDSANPGANANVRPGQTQANGAAKAATQASAAEYAQMRPVKGELEGKLDSKSAHVGEAVALKTTEKMQHAGGIVIPKGSRLLGHVTEVQGHTKEHKSSQIGIEFDSVVLKDGQSFAIHSMIESVSQSAAALAQEDMMSRAAGSAFEGPGAAGPAYAGQSTSGNATNGTGLAGNGLVGDAVLNLDAAGGKIGPSMDPNPTGIPGVMLSGDATGSASGVLSSAKKNFSLDLGTQMVVGVVAAGK